MSRNLSTYNNIIIIVRRCCYQYAVQYITVATATAIAMHETVSGLIAQRMVIIV